jgi:Domain of unknown function (DUF2760)
LRRISLAFRSFFNLLFHGALSAEVIADLGLRAPAPVSAAPAAARDRGPEGAIQILSILQRDARLVDFLMEDISSYSDDQVGAAVRGLHGQARECLARYVALQPVIDGVEGTFVRATQADGSVKFIGNVPAAPPSGGILRHKGWRVASVNLPALPAGRGEPLIAPAEIEIE